MYHVLIVVLMALLGLSQPNSKKPSNGGSPISTMDTGGETGNIPPPPPPPPKP